jgi:hypothetical protein
VKDADVYLLSPDSPRHHTLPFAVSQAFFDGRWMVWGLEETQNLSESRSTSLRHQPQDPHKILKNLTLQK